MGKASGGAGSKPGSSRYSPDQLVDRRRGVEPLHGDRPQSSDLDIAFGQLQSLASDQCGTGFRHLLHSSCKMRRLADGGVVHVQVTADGAHDHLAGIEPYANLHGCAAPALDLVHINVDPPLHPDRRIAGADGVVLVSDRCPEQRHDAVAHDLVDSALVVMDRLHHPLKHWIEQLPPLLGIAVSQELHRALEVGEEDRHLLALALQCALGGEDPLGEMLGGVGLWGGKAGLAGGWSTDRLAALETELRARRKFCTALATLVSKPDPALETELRLRWILVLAPGTPHLTLTSLVGEVGTVGRT